MRYIHDAKYFKIGQSIGVQKIDDNHYCIVYAYCSPKDQYSKKKAREIIEAKYQDALSKMDITKDCSVVIHELNGQTIIDSLIITPKYLSEIIYKCYMPSGVFKALALHSNIQAFDNIDLDNIEAKDMRRIAYDVRQWATKEFFSNR